MSSSVPKFQQESAANLSDNVYKLPAPPLGRVGWPWTGGTKLPKNVPNPKSLPRISIVTPSYGQGEFIEETIRSVLLQGYPNLEYIVMDGASKDNTVEIVKKYEEYLAYWVSEQDRGQSHAINKGIDRCTGEIFNWVNSDDVLMPGALWAVADAWSKKPGCIVSGDTEFFDDSGVLRCEKASGQTLHNFVRFWEADGFGWSQPSTFVPLFDLKALGGIREDLRYCMDYNMMVRLLQKGTEVVYANETLALFRLHSASKTVGEKRDFRLERIDMLRNLDDLPIPVRSREWNRQQAIRLVDVARHAVRAGDFWTGLTLMGRALATHPLGALQETCTRMMKKLVRQ